MFGHCACTPQDRQIVSQIVGALIGVLTVVIAWVSWHHRQSHQRLANSVKETSFGYKHNSGAYEVWDRRTGKTLFRAKSELEAIGFIQRMNSLEPNVP